ncbi:MAG: hypothetical protein ACRCU5_10090 [Rhizobiaceae bacterium]
MHAGCSDESFGRVRDARKRENGQCFQEWEIGLVPISLFELNKETAEQLVNAVELAKQAPFGIALTTIGYIWVLDQECKVWIAVEELALADGVQRRGIPKRRNGQHPASEKKLGHPTLVKGGPARIAGELSIEEISGKFRWVLNCSSGRYCYDEPLRPTVAHLNSVVSLFRDFGVIVMPDYDDAK